MINNVILVGRLTREVEVRKTTSDKSVASFTVAVNDRFDREKAYFINCVAWNQSAEFLAKYADKGDLVSLVGRLTTRSYDSDNGKVYVTEVTCDQVSIEGHKNSTEDKNTSEQHGNNLMDGVEPEELPFY